MNSILGTSRLRVRFVHRETEQAADHLIVYVHVISGQTNDFVIGPLMSNNRGEIVLQEEEIAEEMQQMMKDSPMDYPGLTNSMQTIGFQVDTVEELSDRLAKLIEYYPEEAEHLKEISKECSNAHYRSTCVEFDLPIADECLLIAVTPTHDS